MWVARRNCKVYRAGKLCLLKPGEPVPEAVNWNVPLLVRQKIIQWVEVVPETVSEVIPEAVPETVPETVSEVKSEAKPEVEPEVEPKIRRGGKTRCPDCGRMFKHLARHVCKGA